MSADKLIPRFARAIRRECASPPDLDVKPDELVASLISVAVDVAQAMGVNPTQMLLSFVSAIEPSRDHAIAMLHACYAAKTGEGKERPS